MGTIRVQEDWGIMFRAHHVHKRCEFIRPQKISLSFRRSNDYRNSDLNRGCDNCLQQDQVGNIEMAQRHAPLLLTSQNIA